MSWDRLEAFSTSPVRDGIRPCYHVHGCDKTASVQVGGRLRCDEHGGQVLALKLKTAVREPPFAGSPV